MLKKVSIIVCTYNAENDLKECLDSLLSQKYNEKEIIVVDDASTDGTSIILEKYRNLKNIEFKVVTNNINLGVAGSRNVGIRNATGDIIAFTDADCVTDTNWISQLIRIYETENAAAVGGSIVSNQISNIWELVSKGDDFVASEEGYVSYIQGCNMSFNKNILTKFMFNEEIKYGYEEKLLCDYLVNDNFKIYYRPQALVYHKHRSTMKSLLKRKYLLGLSSIWYRKKQNKLFMFKKHIILFIALCCFLCSSLIPFSLHFSVVLFLVVSFSLLRDEMLYKTKSLNDLIKTFPFLILIEFSHFYGSLVGLFKFRIFAKTIEN